ncbi:MAG: hypothetical protein HYV97_09600 [Bdellovibrio sp.]|nr:hypothetical protein [Bdellovibrio sp.]
MKILIILLGMIILPIAEATCIWTVTGKLTVKDNIYVPSTSTMIKNLEDVKVKVWATTLTADIWTHWGTTRTDSEGNYSVSVIPAQNSASGCTHSRRIRVKAYLDGDYARISSDLITNYDIEINNFLTWHSNSSVNGRTVTLNKYLNNTTDTSNSGIARSYRDTRAAQAYLGYRKLYLKLDEWNLNPGKSKLYWPAEFGFSPPGGWVHIDRNWFRNKDSSNVWHMNNENGLTSSTWRWTVRELTHELLHQWFFRNVYTPNFIAGTTADTHDFIESASLALFEEAAEVQAIHINELVFGINDEAKNRQVLSREGIRCTFENAKRNNGEFYFSLSEIDSMIDANSTEWRDYLNRANSSVANYLALLVEPNWFRKDFDNTDDINSGCLLRPAISTGLVLCAGLPSPMFSIVEAMIGLKNWRFAYPDNHIPDGQRNVKEYYDYLSAFYSPRFGAHKERFLHFGNPAYQDVPGENGPDVCTSIGGLTVIPSPL